MAKKTETTDEFLDEAGAEPRVYELGFHLDPELAQEDVKSNYQTVRDFIANLGTVIAEGEPVKIPLAYTISRMDTTGRRDFNSGFFCWISYETDAAGHEKVATMARENTRIIRFLDIRSTVEEAKHAADMQEIFAQMASEAGEMEEEEPARTEAEAAPAETPAAPSGEAA